MNKRAALLLIIFLIFPYSVFSIATFAVRETEKVVIEPKVDDPDADNLVISYSPPLDENGEWQTSYGDSGEYKSTITVSDGVTSASEDVLIVVEKKEESPKIESYLPKESGLEMKEAESMDFRVLATDLNKDELIYKWILDGKEAEEGQEFAYYATYSDAGVHKLSAVVYDGTASASREWEINVENVDVEGLLDGIEDVQADENEDVKLKIPDFEKYGLAYSISEPLGSKNEWKTGYNDAGSYEIIVHAEGKGFSKDKTVNVAVNDIDRAPVFDSMENEFVNEDRDVKITLNANDQDGDEITYSASNLPEGSVLEENSFIWKPGYDTVRKEGFVNKFLDKFRALDRSFYIRFSASSKDRKIVQNVIITVKDVNRAPVLEDMEPITINEGETLRIAPKAYDPDGDKVKLGYSGFIDTDTFNSGFDDAGTYYVKVTASDGLLEVSKFAQIIINETNRAPMFGKIENAKAGENDNIALLLNAQDPDGDGITYSIDNPPEGSSLKGNVFLWTPGFDVANKKEITDFDLVFAANDGKTETRQIAKVEVTDKNRMPKIIDATKSINANINKPVIMSVKAADEDGDDLTYTWDFGIFQKYKATASHQRTFTSRGAKAVKVTVSDGIDEVEQVINVNVV